jgi:hypothetical protein
MAGLEKTRVFLKKTQLSGFFWVFWVFLPVRSVADPGCLSRIPDPDFYPSRIPDLGSRIQKQVEKRGVKKKFVKHFFVATNFTKCKII